MRFLDGMVWYRYVDGHEGWCFKRRNVPDMSGWSNGAKFCARFILK